MARIPMGDFGRVALQPGPVVRADPAAYGAEVGQAVQRAGQIGMQQAGQEIDAANAEIVRNQRMQEAEARDEQRRLLAEARAEDKAAATRARQIKSLNAQATVTTGLRLLEKEIADGIDDGTVDKGKAHEVYAARAAKLQEQGLEGVDPEYRADVQARLADNIGASQVAIIDKVRQRDRADIKAGGLQFIEEQQRFAALGPKEADEAIAKVRTFWTATGPRAGEDPTQAAQRVQTFAERVRFTQATALVNADPAAALKALRDPNYLPELDPGARTNLIQTADVRVTQAANRAEIQAQAWERKMDREWKAVSTVFEAGKTLTPEAQEQYRKTFKGSPYAAALDQLMAQAPQASAFASKPVAAQSQALMDLQARMNKEGATPELVAAYKHTEQLHRATLADIARDPYQAAAERGVITGVAPLSLDLQQLPGQLARRAADAQQVATWVGKDVSLFRPDEAERVGNVLQAMPPKDRAGALVALRQVMTPGQAQAFAEQLDPKDKATALALAYSDRKTTAGRYTSELILRGQQARLDGSSTKGEKQPDAKVANWSAEFAAELADVFPNQKTSNDVREAAMLISHGIAAEQGGQLSREDRQRALRMAVGGSIVEHNGSKIPLPAGVDEDVLSKRLRTVTPDEVGATVRAGGVPMPATEFLKSLPGLPLMPYRAGQFVPLVGGRPVVRENGAPVVIRVQ